MEVSILIQEEEMGELGVSNTRWRLTGQPGS